MRARMTQIQENIRDSESGAFGLAKSNKAELGKHFSQALLAFGNARWSMECCHFVLSTLK